MPHAPASGRRGLPAHPSALACPARGSPAFGQPHGLQLAHLHRVLRAGAGAARHAAGVEDEEVQPAGRQLPVLRRLEPAVRTPAVGLHGGRLVGGQEAGGCREAERAPRVDAAVGGGQPRHARVFQVRRFPDGELRRADGIGGRGLSAAGAGHRAAGGHLVLHLRHAELHAGHLPASREAGGQLPRLRAVRDLFPAPGVGSDHAPDRAGAAVRARAARERRPIAFRPGADDAGAVPEGGAGRRLPGAGGRSGVRCAPGHGGRRTRCVGRHARFFRADLLRLRRLLHNRDRRGDVPGLRDARQLPLPVRGRGLFRFLATLAHHAVGVAARLRLHPARRQPARRGAHLLRADGDDAARRPVARRELDVRGLGRPARTVPVGRTHAARALRRLAAARPGAVRAGAADLCAGQRDLGVLPRRQLRRGVVAAARHGRIQRGCEADPLHRRSWPAS